MRRQHRQLNCGVKEMKHYRRRGAVIAFVSLSMLLIVGIAALTIDSGRLYLTRSELQNAADAGALAAASAMLSQANQADLVDEVLDLGYIRACDVANRIKCRNTAVLLAKSYISYGRLENSEDLTEAFNVGATRHNAVRVIAKRTTGSLNGPVDLTLARIWGKDKANVSASAVAILDDQLATFNVPSTTSPAAKGMLIPFTVAKSEFDHQAEYGTDEYSFNPETGQISHTPDGIPEVQLFPYKTDLSGNFGILNIGTDNQGSPSIDTQIRYGTTETDLMNEVSTPDLTFVDDAGNPTTYTMTGNPGVKVGLEPALQSRIGDLVGFAIHTNYSQSGSNATYTVVGLRFGYMLEVNLNGGGKRVVVQPMLYSGPDVTTHSGANSTDGYVTRIRLAR